MVRSPSAQVQYPTWVIVLSTAVQTGYRNFGLLLCYVAFLLVAILSPLSVVSIIYMTIAFVCWILHYVSPSPQTHLKRIWLPIVIFDGVVLIAKYVYQFSAVQEYLIDNYHFECIQLSSYFIFPHFVRNL